MNVGLKAAVTLPSKPENPSKRQLKNAKRKDKERADKRQRLGTDTPDDLAHDADLDMGSNEGSDDESVRSVHGLLNTEHGTC